jgi:hypothetical protein
MKNAILIVLLVALLIPFGVSAQDGREDPCAEFEGDEYQICIDVYNRGYQDRSDHLPNYFTPVDENPYSEVDSTSEIEDIYNSDRSDQPCPLDAIDLTNEQYLALQAVPGSLFVIEYCIDERIRAYVSGEYLMNGTSEPYDKKWWDGRFDDPARWGEGLWSFGGNRVVLIGFPSGEPTPYGEMYVGVVNYYVFNITN